MSQFHGMQISGTGWREESGIPMARGGNGWPGGRGDPCGPSSCPPTGLRAKCPFLSDPTAV